MISNKRLQILNKKILSKTMTPNYSILKDRLKSDMFLFISSKFKEILKRTKMCFITYDYERNFK